MDLSIRQERVAGQDYGWAASAHGFDATQSGTIDISALDAEDHYPNGHIESGFAVALVDDKLVPWDGDDEDGAEVFYGCVIDSHTIGDADISVSVLVHGQLNNDKLPFPLNAAAVAAAAGRFIVYGEVAA